MLENIRLVGPTQTIELDRTKTKDYVFDKVDFGEQSTNYSLLNTQGIIGLELDVWHHTLSTIIITGWVLKGEHESLLRNKMRLNRFVVPNRKLQFINDNRITRVRTKLDFVLTQSVRYGTTIQTNNEEFCAFQIIGQYRLQDVIKGEIPVTFPQTPLNFRFTALLDFSVDLAWSRADFADGYRVEISADEITWSLAYEGANTFCTIKQLEPERTYFFRLMAFNEYGLSGTIDIARFASVGNTIPMFHFPLSFNQGDTVIFGQRLFQHN